MKRRDFIKQSALFGAMIGFGGSMFANSNLDSDFLQKRQIGKLKVSALGLGCMGLTHAYGDYKNLDKSEMIKVVHEAIDLGINFFDTAEVYGPHTNESLLGEALKGKRDKVVLATKFGIYSEGLDSSKKRIISAIDGSLSRLKTDCVDLYFQHRVDKNTPIEEVAEVMKDLKKEGKIREWGLSEAGVSTIKRAHAVLPLGALQSEYSMWWREPESEIMPLLQSLNIALVPFSPLGRGFLSGKITKDTIIADDDLRANNPRFQKEVIEANQNLLDFIAKIARSKNATNAQIALVWLLKQGNFIVPIFGTTKIHRLKENLGALNIELSTSELADINAKLREIEIIGERYNEQAQRQIDR